jgi:hypothetical protein
LSFSISSLQKKEGKYSATVTIENPSGSLAFSVNPRIIGATSKDLILPVLWDDNYFALLPKEKKTLKVTFAEENLNGEIPVLAIDGWNINHIEKDLKLK